MERVDGMKLRLLITAMLIGGLFVLAGCGGSGGTSSTPAPTPDSQQATVGPFVIETAASASVNIKNIAHREGAAFVALSTAGVIDWLGTVEPMERLVFTSGRSGSEQIHRANFFGENVTRLTNRADEAEEAQWSPDGSTIVYATQSPSLDIVAMDADGLNERRLTNSSAADGYPTFSPDGRWVAFTSTRDGNLDIHKMYNDGAGEQRLTNDSALEQDLEWNPTEDTIIFEKSGNLYTIDSEGSTETTLTSVAANDDTPSWHPNGRDYTFGRNTPGIPAFEIFTSITGSVTRFAGANFGDFDPTYSGDGEWIVFASFRAGGSYHLFAKQTHAPYRVLQLTSGSSDNRDPDLGSPVPTVNRTLIGSSGSDHGFDPVHPHAIACVAVFDDEGYLNFIRLGVPQTRGANLDASPLENTGDRLVGIVWSVPEMFYVEQDSGIGGQPTLWDMPGTSRTIVLYLDADSGKLVSILDLDDDTSTVNSAAARNALTHEPSAIGATVRGDFRAVYGPDGQIVADGNIGAVEIDAGAGVVRAF